MSEENNITEYMKDLKNHIFHGLKTDRMLPPLKFCPICYTVMTNVRLREDKKSKQCPHCGIILICDNNRTEVRCSKCFRLFANTLSYNDHLIKGICPYTEIV